MEPGLSFAAMSKLDSLEGFLIDLIKLELREDQEWDKFPDRLSFFFQVYLQALRECGKKGSVEELGFGPDQEAVIDTYREISEA
jgi:hypothetical protein